MAFLSETRTRRALLLVLGITAVGAGPAAQRGTAAGDGIVAVRVATRPDFWTPARLAGARPRRLPVAEGMAGKAPTDRPEYREYRNAGLTGLDFSSTRLVPESARLVYPYSTVGKLYFSTAGGDTESCSASVISARLVLTAAHCLYDQPTAAWYSDFRFVPAYSGGDQPFGAWSASEAFVPESWMLVHGAPHPDDFGLLTIEDMGGRRIGDVTGWLGYELEALADNHVTMLGYPENLDDSERMHQVNSGQSMPGPKSPDPLTILYGSDMQHGSSGGPWVQNFGLKASGQRGGQNARMNLVVGLVSYGPQPPPGHTTVMAAGSSVLDDTFRKLINAACRSARGNCPQRGKPHRPAS